VQQLHALARRFADTNPHTPTSQDGTGKDPVLNFFGIKAEDAPVLVGFEMAKNKKYRLHQDLT
jgi:hypothetical protein